MSDYCPSHSQPCPFCPTLHLRHEALYAVVSPCVEILNAILYMYINFVHSGNSMCSCMCLLVFLQADYERRLLQLCREGCKADISQFRETLRHGVDVNIYNEVSVLVLMYSSQFPVHLNVANAVNVYLSLH